MDKTLRKPQKKNWKTINKEGKTECMKKLMFI